MGRSLVNLLKASINLVETGLNPVETGFNPVESDLNPVKTGLNPVETDVNLVESGVNPVESGVNLIESGVDLREACVHVRLKRGETSIHLCPCWVETSVNALQQRLKSSVRQFPFRSDPPGKVVFGRRQPKLLTQLRGQHLSVLARHVALHQRVGELQGVGWYSH